MDSRPGWRTSEFWSHAAIVVGIVLASFADALPPKHAVGAIVLSGCFYSLARGLAKTAPVGTVGGVTVEASAVRGAGSVVNVAPPETKP